MKKILIIISFTAFSCSSIAQYKNDNVLYKTVFTEDLCKQLDNHPGYLLLDVRTPGEYADTSSMGLNIGRFKNALNIEVMDLKDHLAEIKDYKDKPVFVYCSHSQRSRRASTLLADSGFTQVFNINGGMTGIRQFPVAANVCLFNRIETKNSYDIISATDMCNKISSHPSNIILLDVRNDSAYKHMSTDLRINAFGYFKNATHIALADLEANISKIPAGKEIIVFDIFGDDAVKAAEILKQKNYAKVSVLMEGLNRLLSTSSSDLKCMASAYVSNLPYKVISAQDLKTIVEKNTDFLFLDVRTTEEFENKYKNYWQNLGHLKDAVNIPLTDLDNNWEKIATSKTKPVIIYVFNGGTKAHEAAEILVKKGFTKVMVLQGGIFNVGWTAANIKGYASLAKLRVDIPAER